MSLTVRELGGIVRARRIALGLSQADLAQEVGVSRWWVVQLESGQATGAGLASVLAALHRLGLGLEVTTLSDRERPGASELDAIIEEHRG